MQALSRSSMPHIAAVCPTDRCLPAHRTPVKRCRTPTPNRIRAPRHIPPGAESVREADMTDKVKKVILSRTIVHCFECQRQWAEGRDYRKFLRKGWLRVPGPWAFSVSSARNIIHSRTRNRALAAWSADEIKARDHQGGAGWNTVEAADGLCRSTANMTDADLDGVVAYLRDRGRRGVTLYSAGLTSLPRAAARLVVRSPARNRR